MADVFDQLIDTTLGPKNAVVQDLVARGQLYDRVATDIDGRMVKVDGKWLADFASCNYLGLDLNDKVIRAVEPGLKKWGTHPSWARLACSPVLYEELEQKLAAVLGTEDCLVLPTISLIAIGLIPALTNKKSIIFADKFVHKVNHDGCRLARDMGATLKSFRHDELDDLEAQLQQAGDYETRLIVIDGVLSVTGRTPNLPDITALARKYDAILYIDDAHGFGVIGERPTAERPYGHRGNGVVRHFDLGYDNIIYVAGMSKAYSSLAAFIACPTKIKTLLKCNVTSYIVSGPVPVASLITSLVGLEVNDDEGDALRDRLFGYTADIIDAYRARGIRTDNDNLFPIVSAYVGAAETVLRGGQLLFDEGIYVTLQAYPLVPKDKGVLRATPTAANTQKEVQHLIDAMERTHHALRQEGFALPGSSPAESSN